MKQISFLYNVMLVRFVAISCVCRIFFRIKWGEDARSSELYS